MASNAFHTSLFTECEGGLNLSLWWQPNGGGINIGSQPPNISAQLSGSFTKEKKRLPFTIKSVTWYSEGLIKSHIVIVETFSE